MTSTDHSRDAHKWLVTEREIEELDDRASVLRKQLEDAHNRRRELEKVLTPLVGRNVDIKVFGPFNGTVVIVRWVNAPDGNPHVNIRAASLEEAE